MCAYCFILSCKLFFACEMLENLSIDLFYKESNWLLQCYECRNFYSVTELWSL